MCQHEAMRGFPVNERGLYARCRRFKEPFSYSAPSSCQEDIWEDRAHILRCKWSLLFIHLPSERPTSPSGEINALCAVLDSGRVLYCCAYCSHRSASSVIRCYFNFSSTRGKTMNNLHRQEKGPACRDKARDTGRWSQAHAST